MGRTVLIRTDGSSKIGLGHLVRCLALADMLKDEYIITFNSIEIPEEFLKIIANKGFYSRKLGSENEFLDLLSGNEIVILDHYELDSDYQKEVKKKGSKLVCIDDLHEMEFFADLVINHLPGAKPEDYKAQNYTHFALGIDYALLRPSFLKNKTKREKISKLDSVFICFGGSDIKNLTREVLLTVSEKKQFKTIHIVVGPAYNKYENLEEIINSDERIKLHRNLGEVEMIKLMNKCDLAIVPASGILYEVISTGMPVITGSYVSNQKYFLEQFSRLSQVKSAGDFNKDMLIEALEEFHVTENIVTEKYIDGLSPERIRKKFELL